jgi:hypothetical protein
MSALREERGLDATCDVRLTIRRRAIRHLFSCVKSCIRMADCRQETLEACCPSSPWTSIRNRCLSPDFANPFCPLWYAQRSQFRSPQPGILVFASILFTGTSLREWAVSGIRRTRCIGDGTDELRLRCRNRPPSLLRRCDEPRPECRGMPCNIPC